MVFRRFLNAFHVFYKLKRCTILNIFSHTPIHKTKVQKKSTIFYKIPSQNRRMKIQPAGDKCHDITQTSFTVCLVRLGARACVCVCFRDMKFKLNALRLKTNNVGLNINPNRTKEMGDNHYNNSRLIAPHMAIIYNPQESEDF